MRPDLRYLAVLAIFGILVGVGPAPVQAQGNVGFRSGFTEGTGIPPRGAVDLDAGSSVTAVGSTRTFAAGELTAHIPLATRFGLRVHLNSYTWVASRGAVTTGREDVGFGTATTLRDTRGWRPMIALLTRMDAPTSNLTNRVHEWRPLAKFALAWQLPAGFALASNLGVAHLSDHGTRFTQTFGSAWVARRFSPRIGSFSEIVAADREQRFGRPTYVLRSGVTLLATRAVHIDVHASTQLGASSPRRTFGVGLKERF